MTRLGQASLAGLLALGAVAMASAAMAQPDGQRSCFWTRDLRNHTIADSHTLYFNLAGKSVYRVDTTGGCLAGASSTDPIVMRDRASTGKICGIVDLDISVGGARCIITDMTKLTPEEVTALPRRVRP